MSTGPDKTRHLIIFPLVPELQDRKESGEGIIIVKTDWNRSETETLVHIIVLVPRSALRNDSVITS